MSKPEFPNVILKKARTITGKRSRVVVDHILEHGSITTEGLENYEHIAGRQLRRLDVVWEGIEVDDFEAAANATRAANEAMPTFVKRVLRRAFGKEGK